MQVRSPPGGSRGPRSPACKCSPRRPPLHAGALATGGLEGPALDAAGTIPQRQALFVALYCLSGIPIFAMALGQFANLLIERHIAAREQRALSMPITEDEFEFAQQLLSNDGRIDLSEVKLTDAPLMTADCPHTNVPQKQAL